MSSSAQNCVPIAREEGILKIQGKSQHESSIDEADFKLLPINVNLTVNVNANIGVIPQYLVASGIFLTLLSVSGSVLYYTFKTNKKQKSTDLAVVIEDLISRGYKIVEASEEA